MEPSTYPPSPPPSTSPTPSKDSRGFHSPPTNFFRSIRNQLASMEGASQLPGGKTPTTGLLVSLIFSATAGLGLTLIIQFPF